MSGGIRLVISVAVSYALFACCSASNSARMSVIDAVCSQMLRDDPSLSSEHILYYGETSPIFYYGALVGAVRAAPTTEDLVQAARLDLDSTSGFVPTRLESPVKCPMTLILRADRNKYWNDWLIEVSPLVRNVYVPNESGVFVRGALGGGQGGMYYWIGFNPNGSVARVTRLDVSESP